MIFMRQRAHHAITRAVTAPPLLRSWPDRAAIEQSATELRQAAGTIGTEDPAAELVLHAVRLVDRVARGQPGARPAQVATDRGPRAWNEDVVIELQELWLRRGCPPLAVRLVTLLSR